MEENTVNFYISKIYSQEEVQIFLYLNINESVLQMLWNIYTLKRFVLKV